MTMNLMMMKMMKFTVERIMVDMMLNFYMDMAIAVGMTAYNPNYM